METDKSLLIWRQQEAQRILDEVRNHLDVPRVRRRLGRTGDELYQIALAAEAPEVVINGMICDVENSWNSEAVPVVVAFPDEELWQPATPQTPLQRERTRQFIVEHGLDDVADAIQDDLNVVTRLDYTMHPQNVAETHNFYDQSYELDAGNLYTSLRPLILLSSDRSHVQSDATTLIHEFSHANDALKQPLRFGDFNDIGYETELRANSAEVRALRGLMRVRNSRPQRIERVRRRYNGPLDSDTAFVPTNDLKRALAQKGLGSLFAWTQDNEAIDE